jgi:uridine kinase
MTPQPTLPKISSLIDTTALSSLSSWCSLSLAPSTLSSADTTATHLPVSRKKNRKKAIVVAISGCSSSGKTTLAHILAEIFSSFISKSDAVSTESNSKNEIEKVKGIGNDSDDKEEGGKGKANGDYGERERKAMIIHQDNFFLSKDCCPITRFEATSNDLDFLGKSIRICLETTRLSEGKELGKGKGKGVMVDTWDTDCVEAIDWEGFVPVIENLREVGEVGAGSWKGEKELAHWSRDEALALVSEEFVEEQKASVMEWVKKQAVLNAEIRFAGKNIVGAIENYGVEARNRIVFVEGFLLFLQTPIRYYIGNDENTIQHQTNLLNLFDIKLFLPITKSLAKARRFSRAPYIDEPEGSREPGQMWKTEGYFKGVAWPNYLKEHDWLMGGDGDVRSKEGKKMGVDVRPGADWGPEETMRWAVERILGHLERTVSFF